MRKTGRSPVGADRWMISWADLLTLLVGSMVVLYASAARVNLKPAPVPPKAVSIQAAPPGAEPPVNPLAPAFDALTRSLEKEMEKGQLKISLATPGIVISLRDRAYFGSGSADVETGAVESIGKIAAVIQDLPNTIRLEGHSDSTPIHNARFRDNWSLSAARSAAVLTLLETQFGVSGHRLAIAGYADNQPVSENESAEGRAQNRRVDVVILSETK